MLKVLGLKGRKTLETQMHCGCERPPCISTPVPHSATEIFKHLMEEEPQFSNTKKPSASKTKQEQEEKSHMLIRQTKER